MAQLGYESNVEQDVTGFSGSFEVIPPSWYKAVIIESTINDTKAGNGKFLTLKYELQDGTKRTVIDRLNIINPSEVAQKIGRGALAKIALSIGHKGSLSNSNVLHGRPFEIKVEVETFESNKEPGKMLKSNKISDYRTVQAASAPTPSESKAPIGWE